MKLIAFIEQIQKYNPSKNIGFVLCANREQVTMGVGRPLKELFVFEPVGEGVIGSPATTMEQSMHSEGLLIVYIAPYNPTKSKYET